MKKLLLTLTLSLALTGCGTVSKFIDKPNCYERVAISKISLTEAYKSAATLNDSKIITVANAEKALIILDQADEVTDRASAMCPINEPQAYDYLDFASGLITQATVIFKGE